jgi:hypothetical protein
VVDGGISTQSGCSGIHDVVVLVLGQLIEIEGIFVNGCLETQGQFILRGVLNLQIFKKNFYKYHHKLDDRILSILLNPQSKPV